MPAHSPRPRWNHSAPPSTSPGLQNNPAQPDSIAAPNHNTQSLIYDLSTSLRLIQDNCIYRTYAHSLGSSPDCDLPRSYSACKKQRSFRLDSSSVAWRNPLSPARKNQPYTAGSHDSTAQEDVREIVPGKYCNPSGRHRCLSGAPSPIRAANRLHSSPDNA